MQKIHYINWLQNWFGSKITVPENAVTRDFFAERWLTSLDTLTLVVDIETKLHIRLTEESLNDKRFSTIVGLSEILAELAATESAKVEI